jgi:hypothetical protein
LCSTRWTLDPRRRFVNATQGDSIRLPTVHVERRRLRRKWEEMGNAGNQHARYLAERLSLRFTDTAAGLDARSEAAFILTPAGHAEYHAYVISWDKGEPWREANMGTEEQAAAARFAEATPVLRGLAVGDARYMLRGAAEAEG